VPYGQVFVKVPLGLALKRNDLRVGLARVIRRMHLRFEDPQPTLHHWERHTFVLSQDKEEEEEEEQEGGKQERCCSAEASTRNQLCTVWQAIFNMWKANFVKEEATREDERMRASEGDREQCRKSIAYRLDQRLRARVAIILSNNRSREAGKIVSGLKQSFLADVTRSDGDGTLHQLLSDQPSQTDEAIEALLTRMEKAFAERCLAALTPPHNSQTAKLGLHFPDCL